MAYFGPGLGETREPGARRKKLSGYLKAAANEFQELRQSYFQGSDPNWPREQSEEDHNGAFQDAAVVRSGNEEMILFPSYAKRHVRAVATEKTAVEDTGNDAEYWQQQWDKHESGKGVIEVEVRGWIYTPQRGPHTRRQRLMIGLARQLSGIAAPSSQPTSRASSPVRPTAQEEDLINLEAEHIVHEGKKQADLAGRGAFSEKPGEVGRDTCTLETQKGSKSTDELQSASRSSRRTSVSSESSEVITPLQKRDSWALPSKMTAAELVTANKHLLNRLRPFMAVPLVESPVKVFFYNENTSRQRTVYTNPSGHFHCRTVLDFVPTHVRVLAGDSLSVSEEVNVTSPRGVSLISDIDDTIKHTAILSGAREIFRNAFIRDLGDLTIKGVKEWYNRLAGMGVKMHYVSNSPWQMYPVLTTFFKTAGLPTGSFHLKQYSGMLQGIFEPVAERKKSSLDRIMRDFPERKFLLVGDSGEADLEVYTDVVLDNPGRILGVFIRDVTTPLPVSGYFDPSNDPGRRPRRPYHGNSFDSLEMSKRLSRPTDIEADDADLKAAIAASLADMEQETKQAKHSAVSARFAEERDRRPALPNRMPSSPLTRSPVMTAGEEDLIDLNDLQMPPSSIPASTPHDDASARQIRGIREATKPNSSPPRPPKPQALRSGALSTQDSPKAAPPIPTKPSNSVSSSSEQELRTQASLAAAKDTASKQPSPLSQMQRQESQRKIPPPLPARRSYRELAKEQLSNLMSVSPTWQETATSRPRPVTARSNTLTRSDAPRPLTAISPVLSAQRHPSDLGFVPDRPLSMHQRVGSSSSIAASSRKMLNRMSTASSDDSFSSSPSETGMSKKELVWMQRWQRAKSVMDRQGVTLRTWRVGTDVEEITVKLVEAAQREAEKQDAASR